jgi:hypothetical protein
MHYLVKNMSLSAFWLVKLYSSIAVMNSVTSYVKFLYTSTTFETSHEMFSFVGICSLYTSLLSYTSKI